MSSFHLMSQFRLSNYSVLCLPSAQPCFSSCFLANAVSAPISFSLFAILLCNVIQQKLSSQSPFQTTSSALAVFTRLRLFVGSISYPVDKSLFFWIERYVLLTLIRLIAIYPADSDIRPLIDWALPTKPTTVVSKGNQSLRRHDNSPTPRHVGELTGNSTNARPKYA